jgi:hypothetical protein
MNAPKSLPDATHDLARSHRFLERRITRDARVPLSDDDREMEHSWACVPIPPSDDPNWFVLDDSSDRKTTWGRWHEMGGSA